MLLEELPPQLDHPLQILTADVEVGQNARQRAAADQHAAFAHPRAEFGRQRRRLAQVQHVGLCAGFGDLYADLPQLLLQPDRVVMVFAQPRDVMLQSVKTGRRQNTGLTHPAAGHFAPALGALDVVRVAAQQGTHRGAQPFREANGEGVAVLRDLFQLAAVQRHHGVEDARAVHVQRQPAARG